MRNVVTIHGIHRGTIVNVQQAKIVYICKNTKHKLFKTNSPMLYNKICRFSHLTPKYAHVKDNGSNPQSTNLAYDGFVNEEVTEGN
jgi:hypothetical protein